MSDDWKERFKEKWNANSDWVDQEKTSHSQDYCVFNEDKILEFIQSEIRKAKEECEKKSDIILTQVMEERDYAEDMADQLAYKIAPEEIIGEHTSANNPWQNALDYEESDSLK